MRDLHSKPPSGLNKPIYSRFAPHPATIQEHSLQEGDSRDSGYYGNNRNDFHNNLNKNGAARLNSAQLRVDNFNSNNGNVGGVIDDPTIRLGINQSPFGSTTDIADDSSSATSGSYVVDPEDLDIDGLSHEGHTLRESVA